VCHCARVTRDSRDPDDRSRSCGSDFGPNGSNAVEVSRSHSNARDRRPSNSPVVAHWHSACRSRDPTGPEVTPSEARAVTQLRLSNVPSNVSRLSRAARRLRFRDFSFAVRKLRAQDGRHCTTYLRLSKSPQTRSRSPVATTLHSSFLITWSSLPRPRNSATGDLESPYPGTRCRPACRDDNCWSEALAIPASAVTRTPATHERPPLRVDSPVIERMK